MKCESIIVKLSDVKCVLTQHENNFGIALYTLWHLCLIVDCDCAEYVRATLQNVVDDNAEWCGLHRFRMCNYVNSLNQHTLLSIVRNGGF